LNTDLITGGHLTNSGTVTNSGNLTLASEQIANSTGGVITEGAGTPRTISNTTSAGAGGITIGGAAVLTGTDAFAGADFAHKGSLTNTGTITDNAQTISFTDE